ncbi:YetF domain-containing protein [Clostridium omnivorum]|uniref:DUF421 domain-containing protein n=1 Tax=Clostridium omnivorum TaxID=1604902 RepID=A0ABQ5N7Y2_9CLOT|nr:DUF421 domain-containing protein [Clostridium sp. E14]GLC31347.1 DUF421 domain-containing protein [Clostridium sp. E14]
MWTAFINIFLRTIGAYLLLLLLTRLMGRKLISQMTFFDFTVGITAGTITGVVALGDINSFPYSAAALIIFALLAIASSYLHIKSFNARKVLNSEPVVLISQGQMVEENMKKCRVTINELMMLLREKSVFNAAEVEFAILETDGILSVLPKSEKQPLTPSDMKITTYYKGLSKDIIIDGKLMNENLDDTKFTVQWIEEQLKKQGIMNISDVFYAGLDSSNNLYVSLKSSTNEKHGMYGIE